MNREGPVICGSVRVRSYSGIAVRHYVSGKPARLLIAGMKAEDSLW